MEDDEDFQPDYTLEVGDVVLIQRGGFGFVGEDESKYIEVLGHGDYFGGEGVRVRPYDCQLETVSCGDNGVVGYGSFGKSPLILLNTNDESVEIYTANTTNQPSALDKQVSGNHYKDCGIQPIEYIHANGLDYFQGNVIKYTTRHKSKNGKADIEKAIHYLELILELQYGD